jgi:hypothetical protein
MQLGNDIFLCHISYALNKRGCSFVIQVAFTFTGEELETLYIRVCMKGKTDDTFLSIGSPKSTSSGDIFKMIQGTFS